MGKKVKYGAVFARDDQHVILLGYGYLQEERVPVKGKGLMCGVYATRKIKTPVLKLDDGTEVYGCECTEFLPKKEIDELSKGKTIIKKSASEVFSNWIESRYFEDILESGPLFPDSTS